MSLRTKNEELNMEAKQMVLAYLNEQTRAWFGRTFDVDESIGEHIADYNVEWFEIVLLKGEAELLGGEHIPDDTLEKASTLGEIVEAFIKVIDNKTRVLL